MEEIDGGLHGMKVEHLIEWTKSYWRGGSRQQSLPEVEKL